MTDKEIADAVRVLVKLFKQRSNEVAQAPKDFTFDMKNLNDTVRLVAEANDYLKKDAPENQKKFVRGVVTFFQDNGHLTESQKKSLLGTISDFA